MSEILTREAFQKALNHHFNNGLLFHRRHDGDLTAGDESEAVLLAHDAALRERLAAAEALVAVYQPPITNDAVMSAIFAAVPEAKSLAEVFYALKARAEAAEADARVMADQELRRSRMGEFDVRRQRQEANALYRELVAHKAEVEAAVERNRSKP